MSQNPGATARLTKLDWLYAKRILTPDSRLLSFYTSAYILVRQAYSLIPVEKIPPSAK
jgi:hypothetical protein